MFRFVLAVGLIAGSLHQSHGDDLPFGAPAPAGADARGFADVATVTAEFRPAQAKRGDRLTLAITVRMKPGCYTYPLEKPDVPGAGSVLRLAPDAPVRFAGAISTPPGFTEHPDSVDPLASIKHYERPVTFEVPVEVTATAPAGPQTLRLDGARIQVCNESNCFNSDRRNPPTAELEVLGEPLASPPPAPTPPAVVPPSAAPGGLDAVAASITGERVSAAVTGGLAGLLTAAIFWGFVSLATPCVFPMIPITVSLFLKQSNQSVRTTIQLAAVYSLTIIVVLGSAAVLLLTTFQELSVDTWMNLFLGALFVFFAVSLFGLFEVSLPRVLTFVVMCGWVFLGYHAVQSLVRPGFVSTLSGNRQLALILSAVVLPVLTWSAVTGRTTALESRLLQSTDRGRKTGGLIGTIAGALAFSIVSFTCVAPFLGGFAGILQSGGYTQAELALAGLAFAAAFASPFFVLAIFPGLVKSLPKSGGWLDTVKVVMGFLELAAAFKFFRTAELRALGVADLFSYELCLAVWVGICFATGLYLLNLYRLPHDYEQKSHVSVGQLLLALSFFGLGVYLAPGLVGQRPGGGVYAWTNAFLLPDAPERKPGEMPWMTDLPAALAQARAANPGEPNLVFVDFTGVTCANCKFNERTIFPRPEVREQLEKYRLVQLYTDTVPPTLAPGTPAELDAQASANQAFQMNVFQNAQLPLYVVLAPQPDGTTRIVSVYDEGKINNPARFTEFLTRSLQD